MSRTDDTEEFVAHVDENVNMVTLHSGHFAEELGENLGKSMGAALRSTEIDSEIHCDTVGHHAGDVAAEFGVAIEKAIANSDLDGDYIDIVSHHAGEIATQLGEKLTKSVTSHEEDHNIPPID